MARWKCPLENMVINAKFWQGKRVMITGHTGFKGSWLSLWLQRLGAEVLGYSLSVPTQPSLFELGQVAKDMTSVTGDIRVFDSLKSTIEEFQPEIIFHLAAQALVRQSYQNPVETYATNVMGTVHLLEGVRQVPGVRAVVVVTSDKCYENQEWVWGYRESDPMGGFDPYSNSKGCAELVVSSYRNSFFQSNLNNPAVATARAGNVIGGGDWAKDRLVPDILTALIGGKSPLIRNPQATRPWQHVLEPLRGYLMLAEKLYKDGNLFAQGWNFGPDDRDIQPVGWLVDQLIELWGGETTWEQDSQYNPHEANYLKLDCSKAFSQLRWIPILNLSSALNWIVTWTKSYQSGANIRQTTEAQIDQYMELILR